MQKVCAYCKLPKKLTKEHIWPSSIVKKVKERGRYSEKFNKIVWNDLTIKDVCADCNNKPLSEIDNYGLLIFDKYFTHYIDENSKIEFEYDYAMLSRWLLKLSFNSARAVKSDYKILEKYADILINLDKPLPFDFSISLDLVLPSTDLLIDKKLLPASNRICRIKFLNNIDDWCIVRLVAINSYYFWILIQDKPDHEVNMKNAEEVLSRIRGVYINPKDSKIKVEPSGVTMIEMHKDWINVIKEFK